MYVLMIVTIVVVTSAAGYVAGTRLLGLPRVEARLIAGRVLESLGIGILFLLANLATGLALLLVVRATTTWFFGLYMLRDAIMVPISLIQGLAFWWWRASATRGRGGELNE